MDMALLDFRNADATPQADKMTMGIIDSPHKNKILWTIVWFQGSQSYSEPLTHTVHLSDSGFMAKHTSAQQCAEHGGDT